MNYLLSMIVIIGACISAINPVTAEQSSETAPEERVEEYAKSPDPEKIKPKFPRNPLLEHQAKTPLSEIKSVFFINDLDIYCFVAKTDPNIMTCNINLENSTSMIMNEKLLKLFSEANNDGNTERSRY